MHRANLWPQSHDWPTSRILSMDLNGLKIGWIADSPGIGHELTAYAPRIDFHPCLINMGPRIPPRMVQLPKTSQLGAPDFSGSESLWEPSLFGWARSRLRHIHWPYLFWRRLSGPGARATLRSAEVSRFGMQKDHFSIGAACLVTPKNAK